MDAGLDPCRGLAPEDGSHRTYSCQVASCPNGSTSNVIISGGTKCRRKTMNEGDFTMQYLLMLYVNESGWTKLSKAEQEHGVAAYTAYTEALTKAGALKG